MLVGLAAKEFITGLVTGGAGWFTVTLAEHVVVPPAPTKVPVYIVVVVGVTVLTPFVVRIPTLWSIDASVALVEETCITVV
jgi:hypothetical protein